MTAFVSRAGEAAITMASYFNGSNSTLAKTFKLAANWAPNDLTKIDEIRNAFTCVHAFFSVFLTLPEFGFKALANREWQSAADFIATSFDITTFLNSSGICPNAKVGNTWSLAIGTSLLASSLASLYKDLNVVLHGTFTTDVLNAAGEKIGEEEHRYIDQAVDQANAKLGRTERAYTDTPIYWSAVADAVKHLVYACMGFIVMTVALVERFGGQYPLLGRIAPVTKFPQTIMLVLNTFTLLGSLSKGYLMNTPTLREEYGE